MTTHTLESSEPALFGKGPSAWQPILDGGLQDRALAVVDAIAADLQARGTELASEGSLAGGHAGLAVFFGYLHQARPDRGHDETAARFLSAAIDYLAQTPLPPALYSGFAGIAWAAAHLSAPAEDEPDEGAESGDAYAAIDELLLDLVSQSPWTGEYDLISGLAGIGVYAVERLPHPGGRECLRRVVERLAELAEDQPGDVTWVKPPHLIPEHRRSLHPAGEYNLGVAHGIPGVIGLLAQACAADVAPDQARPLLDGAVAWLLKQRLPYSPDAQFGYDTTAVETSQAARSAWCYGDPGIAAALLCAADGVQHAAWRRLAIELAVESTGRPECAAGVNDAGLCHGAAGLGHVYNRLYQATGQGGLRAAARFWFERTLRYHQGQQGIGGFSAWQLGRDQRFDWHTDPGFLEGAAGIGLALLAAATPVEPAWDRVLLLSSRVS
jgi:lantibiotic modifying enzyme